jgi:NitT/TauT family transport system substrate-binding protein
LPLKLILVALKRGIYFLVTRPDIKDVQDLKGKKIAVATVKGTDQLVGEELLRSKGFNPGLVQFVAVGEAGLRAQALTAGAVDATVVSSPHYMYLERAGFRLAAGPPEVGFPAAGLITSARLLQENPQMAKRTLRAILKAHRFIFENREDTLKIMTRRLRQPPDITAQSYDRELLTLSKDGEMTDEEMERLIERIADRRRPLSEVRDFSLIRQARKELDGGK